MFNKKLSLVVLFVVFATLAFETRHMVSARYLPTRANGDRVDKLKELLKEVSRLYKVDFLENRKSLICSLCGPFQLLENEIEKEEYQADAPPRWHPESKLFYKREVPPH